VLSVLSVSASLHSTTLSLSATTTSGTVAPGTASADPDHVGSTTTTTSNKSHTGAIAGGVVGGLVALAALAFALFYCLRKRSSHTAPAADTKPYEPEMSHMSIASPATGPTQRLYDPADPTTFPTAAAGGYYNPSQGYSATDTSSPSFGPTRSSVQHPSPNPFHTPMPTPGVHAMPVPHAGYTGVPEV
jgi:hypothetical protein